MKHLFPLILAMAILFSLPRTAPAQVYAGLHGGITLPQGFYADSRMSDHEWMFAQGHQLKAGAGRGWTAGLDVAYALPFVKGLEVLFCADFMQSGMNKDVQEYYDKYQSRHLSQCTAYEMKLPRLRHIPLMAGVQYSFPLTTTVSLYGQALAGVNLRYITPWILAYADENWTDPSADGSLKYNNMKTCTYASAATLALRLGGGFMVKNTVTLGFNINLLGASPLVWDEQETVRYNIYGNIKELNNTTRVEYYDIRPVMVTISLGYRLKVANAQRHVQDW